MVFMTATSPGCPVVLYYHHINNDHGPVSPEAFSAHLDHLSDNGYTTISLDDIVKHFDGSVQLTDHHVLITFDDGYLDNWVYAWPELKRRNMKAVFFILPGLTSHGEARPTAKPFHEQSQAHSSGVRELKSEDGIHPPVPICRQPFTDLWNGKKSDMFMNWSELRELHAGSLVEIASHGWMHDYVHTGDAPTNFYTPFSEPRQQWPPHPLPREGEPRFATGHSFVTCATKVKTEILDDMALWYARNAFTLIPRHGAGINGLLLNRFREQSAKYSNPVTHENDTERYARVMRQLREGRLLIESEVGNKVNALCWPWGSYDNLSVRAAKEAGFTTLFTTKKGSVLATDNRLEIKRLNVERADLAWFSSRLKLHANSFLINQYARIYRKI